MVTVQLTASNIHTMDKTVEPIGCQSIERKPAQALDAALTADS